MARVLRTPVMIVTWPTQLSSLQNTAPWLQDHRDTLTRTTRGIADAKEAGQQKRMIGVVNNMHASVHGLIYVKRHAQPGGCG